MKIMKIRNIKTLQYHDGVVLFEGRDYTGRVYIGMSVESNIEDELYAIVPVNPSRLELFERDKIDLLSLLTERDDETWLLGVPIEGWYDVYRTAVQTVQLTETTYLPDPGFFLNK